MFLRSVFVCRTLLYLPLLSSGCVYCPALLSHVDVDVVLTKRAERDSLKDRTIVTVFILATASLLGWALVKPFIVKSGVTDVVGRYTPISAGASAIDDELPGPNGRATQGFGGGADSGGRIGRGGAGGRGSISRQGGLNS